MLGHSERRQLFGETDRALALKVPAALAAGLAPILCVGESESERAAGDTERKLRQQIRDDLAGVPDERLGEVAIAYEPIWAIGTGETATPEQAQDAVAFIRALVGDRAPAAAEHVRILYGGSVNPENAAELLALADVDGALVGGASLRAESFAPIVEAASAHDARRPCRVPAWWCSTAGVWRPRAPATPSRWPRRRSSTRSGGPIRTPPSPPAAARGTCPEGQMGNSEVGHLSLGAGSVRLPGPSRA